MVTVWRSWDLCGVEGSWTLLYLPGLRVLYCVTEVALVCGVVQVVESGRNVE